MEHAVVREGTNHIFLQSCSCKCDNLEVLALPPMELLLEDLPTETAGPCQAESHPIMDRALTIYGVGGALHLRQCSAETSCCIVQSCSAYVVPRRTQCVGAKLQSPLLFVEFVFD